MYERPGLKKLVFDRDYPNLTSSDTVFGFAYKSPSNFKFWFSWRNPNIALQAIQIYEPNHNTSVFCQMARFVIRFNMGTRYRINYNKVFFKTKANFVAIVMPH